MISLKMIIDKFKTVNAMKKATPEEIAEVKGVSVEHAQKICEYLKEEQH
mgnify:CR=1 FL=1